MFWALVMTITVGGVPSEYVIARDATMGQCWSKLMRSQNRPLIDLPRGVRPKGQVDRIEFACEKTRVIPRGAR